MAKILKLILISFLLFLVFPSFSQIEKHSNWNFEISKTDVKAGEEIELIFKAEIDKSWYMYSTDFDPELGPMVTSFTFTPAPAYELVGKVKPIGSKTKYDDLWGGNITYFVDHAEFRQKIRVLGPINKIEGVIEYQECSDVDGKCIPHEVDFAFSGIKVVSTGQKAEAPAKAAPETNDLLKKEDAPIATIDSSSASAEPFNLPEVSEEGREALSQEVAEYNKDIILSATNVNESPLISLITFMLGAFLAGILAVLTPCVYPMIPMTVTFFSTHSHSRRSAVLKAIVYGLSIIVIYTVLGILVSLVFGPDALNYASTHWLTNIIFFLVFVIFALSFFGLFEITLPSSMVNKVDAQSDKGGYYGVFFMAFTIVLVSFSCTGPIVTSILLAAAQGEVLKPAIGMFGYSLAFALPFSLFAIFPNWIQNLPKSGGWLNSVKVVLGFIELALAFKFLSIADQVYHWGILDRDIFIVIWVAIFGLMGFYLLGKFKMPGDNEVSSIGIPRLLFALVTFGFVVYLIPGLVGAPLKGLSGLLPPMSSHDFNIVELARNEKTDDALEAVCESPKYANFLDIPHGIKGYFELEQALKCGKETGKPIFIDFTGHGCTNCREMEANVWSDPQVLKKLKEDFIVVALYIDERTPLQKEEIYTSTYDNKVKNTIGKRNFDIEKKFFNSNAQPYYSIVDHTGRLLIQPKGYDLNVSNFLKFLNSALKEFKNKGGSVQ